MAGVLFIRLPFSGAGGEPYMNTSLIKMHKAAIIEKLVVTIGSLAGLGH